MQLLDYLFGAHDESVMYRKAELKAFVALGVEDKLADDELNLLGSVLEFSNKTVASVMVRGATGGQELMSRFPSPTSTNSLVTVLPTTT